MSSEKLYRDPNLLLCFGVTLMVVMGVSSISPTLPTVMKELGVSAKAISLLLTMFTVPGVVLTPVAGVLSDHYGRKRILAPSLLLFGVSGAACALVSRYDLLLVLRFFQGVGAASLGALNITIIGDLFEGRRRTTALGLNAAVLTVGVAGYPVLGGALAGLGWRWPFALPALAIPLAILVWTKMNNPEPKSQESLGVYLRQAAGLLRDRRVIACLGSTLATFILIYGPFLTYLPVHLNHDFGASPLQISLVMGFSALMTGLASSQLGRLAARFSETTLITAAFAFYAVGVAVMGYMPSLLTMALPVMFFGLGQGLNMPSIQSLLTSLAPMEYRGGFISLNGWILRLGQTIGPLLMAGAYGLAGLKAVFWTGSGLAALMFVLCLLFLRKH